MTYIVCVCNTCGKTFIFVLFTTAPLKAYVKCPHCESVEVQEIDVKSGLLENEEKKVKIPRLPLIILEYGEALTCIKLAKMVDEHIEKYDSSPSYIKFSKELYDRFKGLFTPPDIRYPLSGTKRGSNLHFFYRGDPIEVKVKV